MSVREKYSRTGTSPPGPEALQRIETLAPLLERHGLQLVYLFGSAADQNRPRPCEDIDIATLPGPGYSFRSLYADLSQALGTDRLDIADLRHAPVTLQFEVVTRGRTLYCVSDQDRECFEQAVRNHFRELIIRTRHLAPLKRRSSENMTLRKEYLIRAIHELEQVAAELSMIPLPDPAALQANLSLRWTIEGGLLAGSTLIFNVTDHILSTEFQDHAETYEGLLDKLHAHGGISQALRQRLKGAGGFPNILVHEYMAIDLGEVARMAQEAPEIFRGFAAELREWISL